MQQVAFYETLNMKHYQLVPNQKHSLGWFQTGDLLAVHRGVKFSCHFTLTEITERWYALLYDKSVSRLALAALRNLHPQTVASVQSKALYTKVEEQLLATTSSVRDWPP